VVESATIDHGMTAPATPVPPARPAPTHPCARCGAPVALDVGLCERCNPLGLKDAASSQVHGTVFVAVATAIGILAIAAHLAVAGIGPFVAEVTSVTAAPGGATGVVATISVRNDGSAAGTATCRISDPVDRGIRTSEVIYSPMIPPGTTIQFDHPNSFGTVGQPLDVACTGP
jgi:hypothetical protein